MPGARLLLIFSTFLACGRPLAAQQQDLPEAGSAGSFDTLNQSARAGGLGIAFPGAEDDASSALINPACLGQLRTHQAALHHHTFIGDIAQESMLVGIALGKLGGLGLNVSLVDYGTFEGRDAQGVRTHPIGASDLGMGLSWGMQMLPWLWLGSSLRSLRQTLASEVYTSYGLDIGGVAGAKGWRVSFAALDFGSTVGGSSRATLSRLAFGRIWSLDPHTQMTGDLGFSSRGTGLGKVGAGFELALSQAFFLRAAGEISFPDPDINGLRDLLVGGGVRIVDLGLDYAYRPLGELGSSHRASLTYFFGREAASGMEGAGLGVGRAPAPADAKARAAMAAGSTGVSPPPSAPSPLTSNAHTGPPPVGRGEALARVRVEEDPLVEAEALVAAKDLKAAVEKLSNFLQANPRHAPAWALLGRAYLEADRAVFARQCFEESLNLDPAQPRLKKWLEEHRFEAEVGP